MVRLKVSTANLSRTAAIIDKVEAGKAMADKGIMPESLYIISRFKDGKYELKARSGIMYYSYECDKLDEMLAFVEDNI